MLELGEDCIIQVFEHLNGRDMSNVMCSQQLLALGRRHSGPIRAAIDAVTSHTSSSPREKRREAAEKMKKLVHISSGTALFACVCILDDAGHVPHCVSLLDARKGGALFYALVTSVTATHYNNTIKALSLQSRISSEFVTRNMPLRLRKILSNCVVLSNDACIASLFAENITITDDDVSLAVRSGRHLALARLHPVFAQYGWTPKSTQPLSIAIPQSLRPFVSYCPR